jgi:hypothetical protein
MGSKTYLERGESPSEINELDMLWVLFMVLKKKADSITVL